MIRPRLRPYLGLTLIVATTFLLLLLPSHDAFVAASLSGGTGVLSAWMLARWSVRSRRPPQSSETERPPWIAPWQQTAPVRRSLPDRGASRSIPRPPWRRYWLTGAQVRGGMVRAMLHERLLLAAALLRALQPSLLIVRVAQLRPHLSLPFPPQAKQQRPQPRNEAARATMIAPAFLMAAVAGTLEQAIRRSGSAATITALEQHPRSVLIEFAFDQPLRSAQRQMLKEALRTIAPTARWTDPDRLRAPLPEAIAADTPRSLCIPVLRQKRVVIWWSLAQLGHVVLGGDALDTLGAQLGALLTIAAAQPLRFLVHDPHGELRGLPLPQLAPAPDALAEAVMHTNTVLWATRHQAAISPTSPVVLIAVAPDDQAWRDLTALLGTNQAAVHVLVLLGTDVQSSIVRDMCYRLPVIEVGGLSRPALPESHRPPALPITRDGEVVAWWRGRKHWRGKALCIDERSLIRSWLPSRPAA